MPELNQQLLITYNKGTRYAEGQYPITSGETDPLPRANEATNKALEAFRLEYKREPNWDMVRINTVFTTTVVIVELFEG